MKTLLFSFAFMLLLFPMYPQSKTFIYQMELNSNWKMQSVANIKNTLAEISKVGFEDSFWTDAIVPGTVLNSLVQAGIYKDIYKDKNLKNIPVGQFDTSWLFRNVFKLDELAPISIISFEGINYKANVWLNGKLIFDKNELFNPFRQYEKNISEILQPGENVLLIEVFPPKPGDFNIGFVDWNPAPPDKSMGITRNVNLYFNKGIQLNNTFVEAKLDKDYHSADLFISTELTNHSGKDIKGKLRITGKYFVIDKEIFLKKNEKQFIKLNPSEFTKLKLKNPELWWPHTYGKPNLYKIEAAFISKSEIFDKEEVQFGIRKFESYYTPEGHRGIMVNGHKISIRGGGWTDDLTLNDSHEFLKNQMEYVKDMNLNTIRLEGFWGKDQELYKLCDEMGILVMTGWSCYWEWEEYLGKECNRSYGGINSDEDIELISAAWKDQIVWLRNHASVFAWLGGSDRIPKPELEKEYFKILTEFDSTRIYLPSAGDRTSLAGPSGVKMRGPYDYEPPIYWYADTTHGGAFGFNTETGPGAQVPPLESLKKMISADKLWPINDVWEFHCALNSFSKMDRFKQAVNLRYGTPKTIEDFSKKAQLLNYELIRPMFEAFSINRYKATGLIQWMLNSAWPGMYWQLYDSYLLPGGAYYGVKKACQPVQAIYNYSNHSVYLVNDKLEDIGPITLEIKVYDIDSKLVHEKTFTQKIAANQSILVYQIPEIENISNTYFLSLKTLNKKEQVADNFYWLSLKKDVLESKTADSIWFYTPSLEFADYSLLNTMQKGKVEYSLSKKHIGDYQQFDINLTNKTDKIAFFLEAQIIDKNDGLSILPVLWTDNYVTVLPGESKKISAKIKEEYLKGKFLEFSINGY